ncbi:peptidoglycan recognition protein family protein [Streptomyces triticirhizae]|uniref:N-acetylmuramoyl-L-alanine amidase n=1 Tax=Streptomyces triticirhizae TaxID=2483353 RepID=A0A3M2LFU9_9ACTN|nr:N-acetylmuramoyl-L-alanine amidase [Streptomyces triticirhizae]RMI36304.1 N-acetylmuramoyl-L-alanine amidase [Streptomyces triticirhizae]
MATPLSADKLVKALKDEGVKIVEHRSWRTHNRNGAGAWGPVHGVMIHHTVTSGTSGSVDLCYEGHSTLPGPLCHGVIAKDGTVYLVGNGRANHAGSGDGDVLQAVIDERPLPADNQANTDGNARFYGFECVNLGDNKDPWPAAQVEAIVRASAAICRAHGWGKKGDTSVIGHLEWQPGKVDPRGPGVSMGDIRKRVSERLKHPADWSPGGSNPPHEEDDVPKRTLYGTTGDFTQTLKPGTWTTVRFDRRHNGKEWETKAPEPSIAFGACFYSTTVAVRASGLSRGQELQIRVAHYAENKEGGFERTGGMPINSPVHDGGDAHFTYAWNGHLAGSRRLRVELAQHGNEPITIEYLRAETLYWET